MSLKNREVNPLAIFSMRRMNYCPPHFQKFVFHLGTGEKDILDWIYENTEGRFYLATEANGNECVAFEIHSECTYFALMLQEINFPKDYY